MSEPQTKAVVPGSGSDSGLGLGSDFAGEKSRSGAEPDPKAEQSITFESGWRELERDCIDKVRKHLLTPSHTPEDTAKKVEYKNAEEKRGASVRSTARLFTNEDYARLYKLVYTMATQRHNHAHKLYNEYSRTLADFLIRHINPTFSQKGDGSENAQGSCSNSSSSLEEHTRFLEALNTGWQKHQEFATWLQHMFCYLDRYHVIISGVPSLSAVAVSTWVSKSFEPSIGRVVDAYAAILDADRQAMLHTPTPTPTHPHTHTHTHTHIHTHTHTDTDVLQAAKNAASAVTIMLESLESHVEIHDRIVEPAILNPTRDLLPDISILWLATLDFPTYLEKTEEFILADAARCGADAHGWPTLGATASQESMIPVTDPILNAPWLPPLAALELREISKIELLTKPAARLFSLPNGVASLLSQSRQDDLKRAYRLFVTNTISHTHSMSHTPLDASPHGSSACAGAGAGVSPIAEAFKDHVQRIGMGLIEHAQQAAPPGSTPLSLAVTPWLVDVSVVSDLVQAHSDFRHLVTTVFEQDLKFLVALKDAFEPVISSKIAQMPASFFFHTFCDRVIRDRPLTASLSDEDEGDEEAEEEEKEAEELKDETMNGQIDGQTDAELAKLVNSFIEVFAYMPDKDLFAEGYRQQLAKRLLGGPKTKSGESQRRRREGLFLAALKKECGNAYISKIEGMITDIKRSEGYAPAFAHALRSASASTFASASTGKPPPLSNPEGVGEGVGEGVSEGVLDFEMTVQVLTMGHWPLTTPSLTMAPPRPVQMGMDVFRKWYDSQTAHRRLKWVGTASQATIVAHYKSGDYEIRCNAIQATLLLLFNAEDERHCREWQIDKLLALAEDVVTLQKHIQCLYAGSYPILETFEKLMATEPSVLSGKVDKPEGSLGSDTGVTALFLRPNQAFTSSSRAFKLPIPGSDAQSARDFVEQDRSIALQATTMRVMKAAKILSYSQLVSAVLSELSNFRPAPPDIRKALDHLVAREYLKQNGVNYEYVP